MCDPLVTYHKFTKTEPVTENSLIMRLFGFGKDATLRVESLIDEENERAQQLIKCHLLWLVLKYFPHLRYEKCEQDLEWDRIATEINIFVDRNNLLYNRRHVALDRYFMRQAFDKFMEKFIIDYLNNTGMLSDISISEQCVERSDFLLFEIYKLRNTDLPIVGKHASEKLVNYIDNLLTGFDKRSA